MNQETIKLFDRDFAPGLEPFEEAFTALDANDPEVIQRARESQANFDKYCEHLKYMDELINVAECQHWGAKNFAPLYESLTSDYDPGMTDLLLQRFSNKLPWVKHVEVIDLITSQVEALRYRLEMGEKPESVGTTKGLAEACVRFLESRRRVAEREDEDRAQICGPGEDPVFDLPAESYKNLAGLLKDYIITPGATGEEADKLIAYVLCCGRLPKERGGKKLEFCRYRGAAGDAYHFALEFFCPLGPYLKIFNECIKAIVR